MTRWVWGKGGSGDCSGSAKGWILSARSLGEPRNGVIKRQPTLVSHGRAGQPCGCNSESGGAPRVRRRELLPRRFLPARSF